MLLVSMPVENLTTLASAALAPRALQFVSHFIQLGLLLGYGSGLPDPVLAFPSLACRVSLGTYVVRVAVVSVNVIGFLKDVTCGLLL